jgi:hypothetical protein
MTNKKIIFYSMNVHFVCWSFHDLTFKTSVHQCFQLQNLLCDYNKLQSHKWLNIASIIILTLLHMYKHIYAHTHKQLQINHTIIYEFVYIHKCTCTTSYLPMCLWCLVQNLIPHQIWLFHCTIGSATWFKKHLFGINFSKVNDLHSTFRKKNILKKKKTF